LAGGKKKKSNAVVVGIGWLGSHTSWSRGGARTSSLSPTATKNAKQFNREKKIKKKQKQTSRRELVYFRVFDFPGEKKRIRSYFFFLNFDWGWNFQSKSQQWYKKKKEEKVAKFTAPSPIRMDSHVSGSNKN